MSGTDKKNDEKSKNSNIYKQDSSNKLSLLSDSVNIFELYFKYGGHDLNFLADKDEQTSKPKPDIHYVLGRKVEHQARRMSHYKRKSIVEWDDTNELEDMIHLEELKQLRRLFLDAVKLKQSKSDSEKQVGLTREEFIEAYESFPLYNDFSEEFENLFDKLDTKNIGQVTWLDFCSYLILRENEKEFNESLKPKPFNSSFRIRIAAHNRLETTTKLLYMENPNRIINVSHRGTIGLWNPKSLRYLKKFQINDLDSEYNDFLRDRTVLLNKCHVTDAILMPETHRIIIATSKRDLRFFTLSTEVCIEDFCINCFQHPATCLDYFFDTEASVSYLTFGDSVGNIHIIKFLQPLKHLYNPIYLTNLKKVLEINIRAIYDHNEYFQYTCSENVHNEFVRAVKFNKFNSTTISSSNDTKKALVINDPNQLAKQYVFNLKKGCVCFDYNMNLHLLAASSVSKTICIWNIYAPAKPVSYLRGHQLTVIDLKIHYPIGYLYSLSADGALKVWDIKSELCLQSISLNFPPVLKTNDIIDYGPNPMALFFSSAESNMGGLLVSCVDYIGLMPIGETVKVSSLIPLSHNSQISTMVYSSFFKMVITCADDSSIHFWNISTGRKANTIQNAHEGEEITCACLDGSQRRLFTAARNGTIKSWNIINGQPLQSFDPVDDTEITAITIQDQKQAFITVGWSKKLATYNDINAELAYYRPKFNWPGEFQHQDDILCSDSYLGFLATGSYDGEINVWTTETQKLFRCLKKGQPYSLAQKLKELQRTSHLVRTPAQEESGLKKSHQRPNSRHITNHAIPQGFQAPIDKILFLKNRASSFGLDSGMLVSSEAGFLCFWSIAMSNDPNLLGKFYSSSFKDQSVLALCTDSQNKMLISGDTSGFVYIWNIVSFRLVYEEHTAQNSSFMPSCRHAWRAHDSAIVSIEYLSRANGVYLGELLITASSDWTCRLWDLNGGLIGTFGQEKKWNLRFPKTFHSNIMAEIEKQLEEDEDMTRPPQYEEEEFDEDDPELDNLERAFAENAQGFEQKGNSENQGSSFLPKITSSFSSSFVSKSKEYSVDFFSRPSTIYSEPERVEAADALQVPKPKAALDSNLPAPAAPITGRNHNNKYNYLENIRRFKLGFDLANLNSSRFINDEPAAAKSKQQQQQHPQAQASLWKIVSRNRAQIASNNTINQAKNVENLKLPSIK